MSTYNDGKSYTSSGVGTAGLTLGIIGTALASGVLNGGLGNILGGSQNCCNGCSVQTAIAKLEAENSHLKEIGFLKEQLWDQKLATAQATTNGAIGALSTQLTALNSLVAGFTGTFVKSTSVATITDTSTTVTT